jgi:hypothetical protein
VIFKFQWLNEFTSRAHVSLSAQAEALHLFKYASADGTNSHPGLARLCRDELIDAGWIILAEESTRGGKAENFSLSIPAAAEGGSDIDTAGGSESGTGVGHILGSGPNLVMRSALPCRRLRLRPDVPLVSVVVALRDEVSGLLVVQRLSKPAVLPEVRGVIVARRRVLVMPWSG